MGKPTFGLPVFVVLLSDFVGTLYAVLYCYTLEFLPMDMCNACHNDVADLSRHFSNDSALTIVNNFMLKMNENEEISVRVSSF